MRYFIINQERTYTTKKDTYKRNTYDEKRYYKKKRTGKKERSINVKRYMLGYLEICVLC